MLSCTQSINQFPKLLARVIPLSFENLPLIPFPLYSHFIWPFLQLFGMFSSWWILLMIFRYFFLASWSASMKTSFGIISGPRLLFLLSFFMALFSSFHCHSYKSTLLVLLTPASTSAEPPPPFSTSASAAATDAPAPENTLVKPCGMQRYVRRMREIQWEHFDNQRFYVNYRFSLKN